MNDLDIDVNIIPDSNHILLNVIPPNGHTRKPLNICCVVDISFTMDAEAKISNDTGNKESHGFTVLDVVKHGVKTIIACLNPSDSFSLVTFESRSQKICEMKSMIGKQKERAKKLCSNLRTKEATNLWGGLVMGLNILKEDTSKINALFLLTDGQPNIHPTGGEINALKQYKDQCLGGRLPTSINLFGFGYSMDGKLLNDLAVIGGGFYSFIPDASFVGTVFVNAISNIMCTAANNLVITVSLDDKSDIISLDGTHLNYVNYTAGNDLQLQIGSLFIGQTLNIPISVKLHPKSELEIYLSFVSPGEENPRKISKLFDMNSACNHNLNLLRHVNRIKIVSVITDVLNKVEKDNSTLDACHEIVKNAAKDIESSDLVKDPYVMDLLKDLTGQVFEAVSKVEYYEQWGKHYLPSLMGAHLMQICNNFKDPGVQHYGGELFRNTRQALDKVFIKLPPPRPSIKHKKVKHIANMSTYYRSSAPCFTGNCLVQTINGQVRISELKIGTGILNAKGSFSNVECIVKTDTCVDSVYKQPIVEFYTGLEITPWHPIHFNGSWMFPVDCSDNFQLRDDVDAVYSLLLKDRECAIVNGIQCATLAHGLKGNIIGHKYFGTEQIVNDLKYHPNLENGIVNLNIRDIVRNKKTKEVISILLPYLV